MKVTRILDGSVAEATLLDGPCTLNTLEGEYVAQVGQYVVQYDGQRPLVLTAQLLADQFTWEQ